MLDQYQGTLLCVVNHNDGSFAECDVVDAVSINPEASIDDEFWLGPSRVQVHADLLNLDEEHFLDQYPVGKTFRMELTVRVVDENPVTGVAEQVGTVN
jgi:hypothetical protein